MPKLVLATMVRDEMDVLPAFLAHAGTLFDEVIAVDHLSHDGSREFLFEASQGSHAGMPPLELLLYDQPGWFHAEVSTRLAHFAFERGADWVAVLDADEFIDVANRNEFETALAPISAGHALLRWKIVVPERLDADGRFDPSLPLLTTPTNMRSELGKVLVHRTFRRQHPRFALVRGNHLVSTTWERPLPEGPEVGRLLHIPGRTEGQVLRKVSSQIDVARITHGNPAAKHLRRQAAYMAADADEASSGDHSDLTVVERFALEYERGLGATRPEIVRSQQERVVIRALPRSVTSGSLRLAEGPRQIRPGALVPAAPAPQPLELPRFARWRAQVQEGSLEVGVRRFAAVPYRARQIWEDAKSRTARGQ